MNQQHKNLRHAAAQAFIESLDQLQETLQPVEEPAKTAKPSAEPPPGNFDLSSFEQAAADIEQFMKSQAEEA